MVSTAGTSGNNEPQRVKQMQGNIVLNDDIIEFDNVPLRTPNNDTLVESLNFRVWRPSSARSGTCGRAHIARVPLHA